MKDATTKHNLAGQVRKSKLGNRYKIISFSQTVFINWYCTWLIEYVETGKRFYKAEVEILKDKHGNNS